LIAKNTSQGLSGREKKRTDRSVDQSFAEIKINLISASHLFMGNSKRAPTARLILRLRLLWPDRNQFEADTFLANYSCGKFYDFSAIGFSPTNSLKLDRVPN